MRVLLAGSEAVPYLKTGGLADVLGALPAALSAAGHEPVLVLPLYASIDRNGHALTRTEHVLRVEVGGEKFELRLWKAGAVWFLENERLFPEAYGGSEEELALRFIVFGRGVVELLRDPPDGRPFELVHCHDWQTGLIPAWLRTREAADKTLAKIGTLFTIHNLAYQGVFPAATFALLGIEQSRFNMHELEFFEKLSFLKAGLVFADVLSTVSEKYAQEILTPEGGNGLDGLLRLRAADLFGITNGIDVEAWNPETDRRIPARYSARSMSPKDLCRSALMREVGLPRGDDVPLAGMVTRLAPQKGIEHVLDRLEALLSRVRLVILGRGESRYESRLRDAARLRPDRLAVALTVDETLAHRIEAGSDLFLMPSLYEPCGLNQMYSLRYGAVPVVRATGGLDDTVVDADTNRASGNGFKYERFDPDELLRTLDRALAARRDPQRWAAIRYRGMTQDFSWSRAAHRYAELYARAAGKAAGR